ncbi:XRE family transcriptional regulator [Nocardia sp. NPDC052566]|uniref:XRE family transcriptional regulator n=1 Tax=Nocardia sp. NPDC052566 TaxID=3364330 RepID=UPI0037C86E56
MDSIARRQRFGQIVKARRKDLGISLNAIANYGGPSNVTVGNIERAEGPVPRAATRDKLDTPLRWLPGSAARTWEGGDPAPVTNGAPSTNRSGEILVMGPHEVPVPLESLRVVLTTLSKLQLALDQTVDSSPLRAAAAATVAELNAFVSESTGAWLTELLERNAGGDQPVHPVIDLVFSSHLAGAVDPTEHAAEDKLYRRWLAGHLPDVDASIDARFRKRLLRKRPDLG